MTDYYLDISSAGAVDSGPEGEIKYTIQLKIDADDPDERVALFRELIEGDMDDEDEITRIFNKTLAQIKEEMIHGSPWNEHLGDGDDDIQESMHRRWTRFLLDV